jgi:phenylpyruvate tautomerase PptA (4-oxalocrotonate tautomerase family)
MPVFINEVVIRTSVQQTDRPAAATAGPAVTAPDKDALVAEVTQAVIDYLERGLDRMGER